MLKERFEVVMSQIRLDAGHIPIENGTGAEEISTEASISQLYGKSRILCLMVEVEETPLGVHLSRRSPRLARPSRLRPTRERTPGPHPYLPDPLAEKYRDKQFPWGLFDFNTVDHRTAAVKIDRLDAHIRCVVSRTGVSYRE